MTSHGMLSQAISVLQEALSKDPFNGQLHHAMAGLLILCGELAAAAPHVSQAEALGIPTKALRCCLEGRDFAE